MNTKRCGAEMRVTNVNQQAASEPFSSHVAKSWGDEEPPLQKDRDFTPLPNLMRMAKDIEGNKGVTMEFTLIYVIRQSS